MKIENEYCFNRACVKCSQVSPREAIDRWSRLLGQEDGSGGPRKLSRSCYIIISLRFTLFPAGGRKEEARMLAAFQTALCQFISFPASCQDRDFFSPRCAPVLRGAFRMPGHSDPGVRIDMGGPSCPGGWGRRGLALWWLGPVWPTLSYLVSLKGTGYSGVLVTFLCCYSCD